VLGIKDGTVEGGKRALSTGAHTVALKFAGARAAGAGGVAADSNRMEGEDVRRSIEPHQDVGLDGRIGGELGCIGAATRLEFVRAYNLLAADPAAAR
jgi:hypothetical protein